MHSAHTRRRFIEMVPLTTIIALTACSPPPPPKSTAETVSPPAAAPSPAPTPAPASITTSAPMLDEKDPQAVALGYVQDTARADKAKFSTYITGSQCSGCALYQGKAGDAAGGCTLFPGKNVTAQGWCSAWAKKA